MMPKLSALRVILQKIIWRCKARDAETDAVGARAGGREMDPGCTEQGRCLYRPRGHSYSHIRAGGVGMGGLVYL